MSTNALLEKYRMYQAAVQDPHQQIRLIQQAYEENFGRSAKSLREDFSGTFWISSEWVKGDKEAHALAIDIEAETLEVGKQLHYEQLSKEEKSRLTLVQDDVLKETEEKFDVIAACNFSYFVFHERPTLVEYFRSAFESLNEDGVLILETAGGSGFEDTPFKEKRTVRKESEDGKEKKWFRYIWEQRSFDPIHRRGEYIIHFNPISGEKIENAFVYDWRIWTIPEVADALKEVGFSDVQVYWEQEDEEDEDGNSVYEHQAVADNDFDTWIVYIVGVRGAKESVA